MFVVVTFYTSSCFNYLLLLLLFIGFTACLLFVALKVVNKICFISLFRVAPHVSYADASPTNTRPKTNIFRVHLQNITVFFSFNATSAVVWHLDTLVRPCFSVVGVVFVVHLYFVNTASSIAVLVVDAFNECQS